MPPFRPGPIPISCVALALGLLFPGCAATGPVAGAEPSVLTSGPALAAATEPVCVVDPPAPHGIRELRPGEPVVDGSPVRVGDPGWEEALMPVKLLEDTGQLGGRVLLAERDVMIYAHPEGPSERVEPAAITLLGLADGLPVYVRRAAVTEPDSLLAFHAEAPSPVEELMMTPAGRDILQATDIVFLPDRRVGCMFVSGPVEIHYPATAAIDDPFDEVSFPPKPSSHLLVDVGRLSPSTTVGGVARDLHDHLVRTGHGDIFFVPVPGGVAVIAAAPESATLAVEEDRAAAADTGPLLASVFSSLTDLARRLFQGRPGEHRAIALVLSDRPWEVDVGGADYTDLTDWQAGGGLTPPDWLDEVPLSPEHHLVAALYVFRQLTVDDPATLVEDGVDARTYLEDVGLITPDPEEP